jgi:23S rRNA pseudouridine1911/1915/1917 synthase
MILIADEELIICAKEDAKRLDVFLSEKSDLTRSNIKNLIGLGKVTVNGRQVKAGQKISAGDEVRIVMQPEPSSEIFPQDIPIDIVYQDQDMAVVNKPQGMVVHPAAGNEKDTLVNALLFSLKDLSGIGGKVRPGIVHRLDKDTSGLLVVAKNNDAHLNLSEQIKTKKARRIYRALVVGNIKDEEGRVDLPIGRHRTDRKKMAVVREGRRAVTEYRVIERFGRYTYIECALETGRTHQIRVHMKQLGHPVVGDEKYGKSKNEWGHKGQFLHAYQLGLYSPSTGEYMQFTAPLPEYFEEALSKLRSR